jgi:hypothetical protein
MKRSKISDPSIKFLIITAFALLLFFPAASQSYTVNDPVGDRIGAIGFETYGIDAVNPFGPGGTTIKLYTNFPSTGIWCSHWHTLPADLALDFNRDGIYESAIALTDHDGFIKGGLYRNVSWHNSDFYAPPGGYNYNHSKIVRISAGDWAAGTTVSWSRIGSSPRYCVAISGMEHPEAPFDIFWATATCANDYTTGHVAPVPASILFMGSGLFGLGVYLKRYRMLL